MGANPGVQEPIRQEGHTSFIREGVVEVCGGLWKGPQKRALKFETRDVANFAAKLFQEGGSGAVVSAAITALDDKRGL